MLTNVNLIRQPVPHKRKNKYTFPSSKVSLILHALQSSEHDTHLHPTTGKVDTVATGSLPFTLVCRRAFPKPKRCDSDDFRSFLGESACPLVFALGISRVVLFRISPELVGGLCRPGIVSAFLSSSVNSFIASSQDKTFARGPSASACL